MLDTLAQFSPLNTMSRAHLRGVLRYCQLLPYCRGQLIFQPTDTDGRQLYLVQGSVLISDASGKAMDTVVAASEQSLWPLPGGHPRSHRCDALEDTMLLSMPAAIVDALLCWSQSASYLLLAFYRDKNYQGDLNWISTLLNSNLFHRVSPLNIAEIVDQFYPQEVCQQQLIIGQGESGDCCYLIKSGAAEVFISDTNGVGERLVARLCAGQCFGEEAMVNDLPRNASVRMTVDGVLMRLDKKDFYKLLSHQPVIQIGFTEASNNIASGSIWLDVRSQQEYEQGHCYRSINMPLNILQLKSQLLQPAKNYIVYCNSGRRSTAAAQLLARSGIAVKVLRNGIDDLAANQQLLFQAS
jgi:rhodanese-related sulfurtransferase